MTTRGTPSHRAASTMVACVDCLTPFAAKSSTALRCEKCNRIDRTRRAAARYAQRKARP